MRLLTPALLFAGAIACACQLNGWASLNDDAESANIISLNGTDWFIHPDAQGSGVAGELFNADTHSSGWIQAHVPGNVQADLESAHLLNPIWYGAGDPRLVEVARKDWWYRKDFVPPSNWAGRRVKLVFDGVDYQSEVWLNGKRLGAQAGMFRRFWFDVADHLKPGEKNQLAVRITRMPDELLPYLVNSDGKMSGQGTPYFFVDGMNKTRQVLKGLKSVTNFGYDWGVNVWTLGIWKDVRLEASGPARIDWVQVQTALSDHYQKAVITARLEVNSPASLRAKALFRLHGSGQEMVSTVNTDLTEGTNVVTAQLVLDQPALWWPNGQGGQPLYELDASIASADTGESWDTKTTRFGVREIRWEQVEGAPRDFINPFRLVINGRPVRTMGANLLPPDLLFGRIEQRGVRLFHLAKAAGMNTFRVWGGGVILPDRLYDLADQLGLMLVLEFPLANCSPETDPVFLANLESTIRNIVKQIRNHPSIIEWDGGNEMSWQQGTDHPALHVLERVTSELDNRMFRATCPIQGSMHSPWNYDPETHYSHYNTASPMRYGEFGCQSPANLEVWQREIPPSSRWPIEGIEDPILIRKNVVQAVFGQQFWLLKPVIESLFGPADNLAELVAEGQFAGAEGLRYAMDALRQKGGKIGGFTSWDYDEPWPNGAGSYQVDYDGQTLMNYDFVKQALAPAALALRYNSIQYDPALGIDTELWLVSDAPHALSGLQWRWLARDRRGEVIGQDHGTASVESQEALRLGAVSVKPPTQTALGPLLVELQLADATGKLLTERLYAFGADTVAGPLRGLIDNRGPDADDPPLSQALQTLHTQAPLRVLWIEDWHDGRYNAIKTGLHRKYRFAITTALADPKALAKLAPDTRTLMDHFDVVWLTEADYRNPKKLAERIGKPFLSILAEAVNSGLGLGTDGGWGGYGDAGLEASPIADVLPVTFSATGDANRGGPSSIVVSAPQHPLSPGKAFTMVPGYNRVKAKPDATVILKTDSGDDILTAGNPGQGRVLAYAAGTAGGWAPDSGSENRTWIARMLLWLADKPDALVAAAETPAGLTFRPVRRTVLRASTPSVSIENDQEVLRISLANDGPMTALFCEPHPLIAYRTDLFIDSNNLFIPPGESRTLTIRASIQPKDGLTLAQTGWRISCWNAEDVLVEPAPDMLLSVGRQDEMCQEFSMAANSAADAQNEPVKFSGSRPEPSTLPYLLEADAGAVQFSFQAPAGDAVLPARLRLHTADQSPETATAVEVVLNGKRLAG
ncbi:MAG: glutamine amidotransferase, partial [Candidatus Omnitrophica bacterium]|nr:glutamine amidotransferase [Candidatus Omnitrophota bacterium]